jgi:putative colanic acid biosynthesis UDP-glucose lipid carrier transferase
MTGWAQINGLRGETTRPANMQRQIELDLWYVQNRSFVLDLRILIATALRILPGRSNA